MRDRPGRGVIRAERGDLVRVLRFGRGEMKGVCGRDLSTGVDRRDSSSAMILPNGMFMRNKHSNKNGAGVRAENRLIDISID